LLLCKYQMMNVGKAVSRETPKTDYADFSDDAKERREQKLVREYEGVIELNGPEDEDILDLGDDMTEIIQSRLQKLVNKFNPVMELLTTKVKHLEDQQHQKDVKLAEILKTRREQQEKMNALEFRLASDGQRKVDLDTIEQLTVAKETEEREQKRLRRELQFVQKQRDRGAEERSYMQKQIDLMEQKLEENSSAILASELIKQLEDLRAQNKDLEERCHH